MTKVSAQAVKELRDKTGLGIIECQKILQEAGGDQAKAMQLVARLGRKAAEAKAARATSQGRIETYIHHDGKTGAMIEVNCESDFVARNEAFRALCKSLAMQVAAAQPECVRREDLPAEVIERETAAHAQDVAGKPDAVRAKILEEKLKSFYEQRVLLDQPFIQDSSKTVRDLIAATIAKTGENIQVARFVRFRVGDRPG